jgi:hypothetical protein
MVMWQLVGEQAAAAGELSPLHRHYLALVEPAS